MAKKKRVIVGMSGGVDSTVSAILLKQQGYDVTGVFMMVWDEKNRANCGMKSSCYGPEEKEIENLEKISKTIGIIVHFIDLKKEFHRYVLDYFKNEYLSGKTPNPCVVCNRLIKFQLLLEKVQQSGIEFDYFATGHYARVEYDGNRYMLKKGIDENKDQSYFLFLLTQEQLSKIIFPLGYYTKKQVREIAKKFALEISEKEESQDFISGDRFFLFQEGLKSGTIVDKNGKILGQHRGIIHYTIGQRRKLGISGKSPLYVIEIRPQDNTIVVGEEKDLYREKLIAENVNFIAIESLEKPLAVQTKIRYKHKAAFSVISPIENNRISVVFNEPQRAITPGQAAVFYDGDIVVGGGFIAH
ncbi:MAG TPA: tRNA 2-thiouridine(34) synthase MnmA [bacterium]|nr:tRNA 2-thiouridine(34) synthase MnmA [bacterium]HOL34529.1 tRNA 2-thiouridine(34) synthase MnmA [bacterium]HPP08059.1 tRNA 2-thiouridine(34) synthase MnmA [bacterium]